MKKLWILVILAALLTGCTAVPTFETVEDVYMPQEKPEAKAVLLQVPQGAQVLESSAGTLYLCDGFEIVVQTMDSGDLDETIRAVTGFGEDALTVLETGTSDLARYECAWSAAGEAGQSVARAVVLDDGDYHYCLSVMASAERVGELAKQWQDILNSFGVE